MTVLAPERPDVIQRDGWLCHGEGVLSACTNPHCEGWRGNAVLGGARTDLCPRCERDHPDSLWDVGTNEFMAGLAAIVAPRKLVRVGRNDPCPCNSGKKAKKCHPEYC